MSAPIDILLVDDEARNLDALEAILADSGYRLLRAENADRALRLLLDHEVAAIILDIKMPGMSGIELARLIKNTKKFRETPVVFLTAYMLDDADIIAGYGAGGVDYLTKPVNPLILRHKIGTFAELFRKTRDLAELNEKLEERVRERTAELEKSEAALRLAAAQKDEFLAVLAHELRNPLAPLRAGVDLLLRRLAGMPDVGRTLDAMDRQLHHIVRLVADLLDVSRISRGLLELKKERVDVGLIVQSAVDGARTFFDRRKQVVSVDVAPDLCADADPTRLAQILTNLLHNAAKFTPVGGQITVSLAREGESAVIRVVDSGAGIAADQIDRVFDMFARVVRPGATTESGLGIGLALARRLATMHGGTLTAESAGLGHGTTFTLSLPARPATEAAAARPRRGDGPPPAALGRLKILVIEDNEDVADTLTAWLDDLGHEVWVARTGQSGLDMVKQAKPNVVLCDLGLPGLDGLDVCRSVTTLAVDARPTMVALTGWGREDDLRRTREAGFDYHLVKPVDPEQLFTVLRSASTTPAAR
jgi:signal transduction histidine kinase